MRWCSATVAGAVLVAFFTALSLVWIGARPISLRPESIKGVVREISLTGPLLSGSSALVTEVPETPTPAAPAAPIVSEHGAARQWMVLPRGEAVSRKSAFCRSTSCEWHSNWSSSLGLASIFLPSLWPHEKSFLFTKAMVFAPVGKPPFVNPRECFGERRSLLVIGHSHSRYVAGMLCMMLNASDCDQFAVQDRNVTVVGRRARNGHDSSPPLIAFVQANYDLRPKVEAIIAQKLVDPSAVTTVLMSRGIWDLMFLDRVDLGPSISDEVAGGLELLLRKFPNAKVVVHLPHFVHNKVSDARKPRHRATLQWRAACMASEPRLQLLRDANKCAVRTLRRRGSDRLFAFDTWNETKSQLGAVFVDGLGHHYLDAMLESLTMKFISDFVCPTDEGAQGRATSEDVSGDRSCDRVREARHTPLRECMCHNRSVASSEGACSVFAKFVPLLSVRN